MLMQNICVGVAPADLGGAMTLRHAENEDSAASAAQAAPGRSIDAGWFRTVLGQYPTGVCVVTAVHPETGPAGMVVGSFTSVSLDPPMVAFFPDRSSTSWPKVERAGAFCVNILGADQESVCRRFAAKGGDKFAGQAYRPTGTGSPILEGCVAWIDCEIEAIQEAGDHFIVLGRVRDMQLERPRLPLLFFQGGYGRFTPSSLTAPDDRGRLTQQLRQVDLIRGRLEELAADLGCMVNSGAQLGDEVVIVAVAGGGGDDGTLVGQRLPFLPPSGSVFAAWSSAAEIDDWLAHGRRRPEDDGTSDIVTRWRRGLKNVRRRGYSVGLLSPGHRALAAFLETAAHDPAAAPSVDLLDVLQALVFDPDELTEEAMHEVRQISAPVFDEHGRVALALTAYGFRSPVGSVAAYIEHVCAAAASATRAIGGVSAEDRA
jgi:flavin reductase (DIM6/NTAB) family NADH-FMN oxidoreductase RutF/DNA-binding IclR family transcriptional regulator